MARRSISILLEMSTLLRIHNMNWQLSAKDAGIEQFSIDDSQLIIEKAGMLIFIDWKDYRRLSIDLDRWLSIDVSQ